MRPIESLTDDEIIDTIAEYGVDGFDIRNLGKAVDKLQVECNTGNGATLALEARMYSMYHDTDRICRRDDVYMLSNTEWGRRIAAMPHRALTDLQFAQDIASALLGVH